MPKSSFLTRRSRHVLLAIAVICITIGLLWQSEPSSAVSIPIKQVDLPAGKTSAAPEPDAAEEAKAAAQASTQEPDGPLSAATEPQPVVYEIQPGDTLSEIFDAHGISANTLHKLLEADAEFLSLETIQPGTTLTFTLDGKNQPQKVDLQLDVARTVSYSRTEDGGFEHQEITKPLHWDRQQVSGEIHGSFYASGLKAGLDKAQVAKVGQLLKSKLNFRRDLRAGDTFSVIVGHEHTDTQATGNTRIDAIELHRGSKTYYAFLYSDGNYYDETGDSVTPAFLRWPTKQHYRITSPFDPNRLHPITGRRAPHNGVDLGSPSGTPVMSTGDGIVSRIGNHPYAGKYVEIEHSGTYKTRYLHLSKILVHRGETVKRGEKIALSGATGRVTGPHLHFELHVNHHPVNPLTAKIPTSAHVPADRIAAFRKHIRPLMARLNVPSYLPARQARDKTGAEKIPTQASNSDWTQQCLRPGQCRFN
ncbi:hypothetical protein EZI54_10140 [Marinobacter halodurans]|uniref:LysM domain-containing protein n=1 Tax=Marinobacter halodurans TaxID=2528979 RepID=A0ABY1ZMD8_9GAMM|nr:peptidoglycan DD-metalloendopeptidase family protein [Marinobacter halodurans]TBW55998.1 hypothetical protein EZI54_10140 [Marinobacter halodurans]